MGALPVLDLADVSTVRTFLTLRRVLKDWGQLSGGGSDTSKRLGVCFIGGVYVWAGRRYLQRITMFIGCFFVVNVALIAWFLYEVRVQSAAGPRLLSPTQGRTYMPGSDLTVSLPVCLYGPQLYARKVFEIQTVIIAGEGSGWWGVHPQDTHTYKTRKMTSLSAHHVVCPHRRDAQPAAGGDLHLPCLQRHEHQQERRATLSPPRQTPGPHRRHDPAAAQGPRRRALATQRRRGRRP